MRPTGSGCGAILGDFMTHAKGQDTYQYYRGLNKYLYDYFLGGVLIILIFIVFFRSTPPYFNY